jgi:hypothetical protein
MSIPQTTLAGMYNTKEPFLESNKVSVIARKFNYIPTAKGEGDPPAMQPYNPFGVPTITYGQHAVKCDLAKTNAFGGPATLWNDADYDAVRKGMDMDYDEKQDGLKKAFKPSEIVNFLREEADNTLQSAMRDYFIDKAKNDEESKRYFLEQYGLTPDETNELMRQKKVDAAAAALERRLTNPKMLDPSRRNLTVIASDYHRGDIPQTSMNVRSGIGSFDLGITGFEGRIPHYQASTTAAGRRAMARASTSQEAVVQDALAGLPDRTDAAPMTKEQKKAMLEAKARQFKFQMGERKRPGLQEAMFTTMRTMEPIFRADTETTARLRTATVGEEAKREIIKEFKERRGIDTLETAEKKLKKISMGAAGRRAGGASAKSPSGAGEE